MYALCRSVVFVITYSECMHGKVHSLTYMSVHLKCS